MGDGMGWNEMERGRMKSISYHEFHETCHSVTFYFMRKVVILNQFNIVFNGEHLGTKLGGHKIYVVLILRL